MLHHFQILHFPDLITFFEGSLEGWGNYDMKHLIGGLHQIRSPDKDYNFDINVIINPR